MFIWDVNCKDEFVNFASDFTEPLAPVAAQCLWWTLKGMAGKLAPCSLQALGSISGLPQR